MNLVLVIIVHSLSIINYANTSGVKKLIQFEFITDKYSAQSYTVDNFDQVLDNPNFDRQKPTAIYSYGFTQTVFQPSVREIVDAYLENGDFNFVLMNYNSILAYNVLSANEFGEYIASSLIKIFETGYGNFHLIGFSLGAQISGVIGRCVIEISKQKFIIPRITGLDPGQIPPFFEAVIQNLNAGDATFVDTIHGESKFFGSASSVGNASFWINGGFHQPSCKSAFFLFTSICSHLMTPKYWAASVRSKNSQMFPATKCESFSSFKSNNCEDAPTAYMGLYVDTSSSGHFYLDAPLLDKEIKPSTDSTTLHLMKTITIVESVKR